MAVSKSYDCLISDSLLPRNEARALLAHVLSKDKSWVIAHGDETGPEEVSRPIQLLFLRRRNGEPMAYLLGAKEFYGRSFSVGPGVLIPRPETELMVDWALEVLRAGVSDRASMALDLGCGTGCIGLSLALEAERLGLALAQLTLVDCAPEAIEFTQRNTKQLSVHKLSRTSVNIVQGSWFDPIDPSLRFDLIVSNPPYIRLGDAHLSQGDLRFEPPHALSSGESGLQAVKQIITEAAGFLQPSGRLLLEHGYDQAVAIRTLFQEHGYISIETRADLAGHDRVSAGRKR